MVDKLGPDETHAYDAANQCVDAGFTHDECGNLTSDGEWVYAYERGSRLASATNEAENLKLVFGYDPRGRRYSKCAYERDGQGQYTVQKYAVYYHYDAGGNVLAETDAAGNLIRSYAYDLSGHPVAMTQDLGAGQKTFFLHSNARGDVIYITDENMNWAKRFSYDPWGRITQETSSSPTYDALSCPYAYAGYFRDSETGLYYMPARYYSPFQRRFLTKDPHPGSKSRPITLNPYQYCGNNPINNVDPTGQYDFSISIDCSGMNAYFNQMAADNAARSQAMSISLGGFVSAMSNFRASIHIGNIAGAVSGVTAWSRAFSTFVNHQKAGAIIGQMFQGLGHILATSAHNARCRECVSHWYEKRDFMDTIWKGIDTIWTGANIAMDWTGGILKYAGGAGWVIDGIGFISSTLQDVIHVASGDMTWSEFNGNRLLDLGSFIPYVDGITIPLKTERAIDSL
jgi:RHS repeat-associated protein